MVEGISVDKPRLYNRALIICGAMVMGLLFLMLIPSAVRSSEPQQGIEGWQVVVYEDFDEGLGAGWTATDASSTDGGEYTWGTATYTYTSPITSVWGVGGGADGEALVAGGTYTYPKNVDSWLVYGPIDVSGVAFQAELSFDWWLDSSQGDWFGWCLADSVDDLESDCSEVRISGSIGQWISGTYSLDVVPGETESLYVVFHFESNDDEMAGVGAFVDHVSVQLDRGQLLYLPVVRYDPTPTPSPTPTPAALYYYDTFNSESSGWPTHTAECCLSGCDNTRENLDYKYNLYYADGRYHVFIPLDCRATGGEHGDTRHIYPFVSPPGITRPTTATCIEVRGQLEEYDAHWSWWGLVFAANNSRTVLYSLEVNNTGDWAVLRREGYQYPGPNHPYLNEDRIKIVDWWGGRREPANPGLEANTLRVRVAGDNVVLYINGQVVHSFTDGAISDLRQVGIIGGDWEITPTRIGWDYFLVDEGCDGP
jgi:hypothetical protein